MCIIAIRSRRNIKSSKKQKVIDIRKDVSRDTSFLVGCCVKGRKSCGANTGTEDCRIKIVSSSSKHLARISWGKFNNLIRTKTQIKHFARISRLHTKQTSRTNILGENLIILFAQPHFRNLLFRI